MASNQPEWDKEATLYRFECAIDILDKISDGLPDDRITTNALNGLRDKLSNIHAEFGDRLMV